VVWVNGVFASVIFINLYSFLVAYIVKCFKKNEVSYLEAS
jgi:hypothetical protein